MNNLDLQQIKQLLEYKFNDSNILRQAFKRRSYSQEKGGENNEVLEFIGDKALDFIVVKKLAEYYGNFNKDGEFSSKYKEGKLTEIKKKLVNSSMLAHRIDILGLNKYLIMGNSDIKNNIQDEEHVKEDLFEAIVGAVAIDGDWDIDEIQDVVEKMLDIEYYLENGFNDDENYVDLIQQWTQKQYGELPLYNVYLEDENAEEYTCELTLPDIDGYFEGEGYSKSQARMDAAAKAYEYLDENDMLLTMEDEIGEPDESRAINQLQELAQKGYINMPEYVFEESHDDNGNPVWHCECHVDGQEYYYHYDLPSKKEAKRKAAYSMLRQILGYSDD